MLKIGISSCFMYPDPSRLVFGPKNLAYVESDMFRYVAQEGVLPVLIPDLPFDKLVEILKELDGFVFQGGTDLSPQTYGEEPIQAGKWLGDPYRDKYEMAIMDFAIRQKKPILAICRGIQLLNVHFGGTLYQDIATQVPQSIMHRNAEKYDSLTHQITFAKNETLDKIYKGIENPMVNSVHHQGIKTLGKGLKILARCSEDGMIEAVEANMAPNRNIIGVQWHPEFSVGKGKPLLDPLKLYSYFIEKVKNQ
ncbi:gamma-glutamyl-gamma-aminobutyrate hydrolase family protein [Cyclobacterium sp.]|uniref:gamma-glutamyl-gamma-aminobutyrate hydrolase family protein n=1 Tax=Cyclobacterium sp. TaxID=1966343 RepID=UPI0019C98F02|nr:gamma-glutamyl-gamma-aminobutyrate hydrolase family protein [Cyclobacterium sp.]MBD3629120.1 gamma-glutamyl-gamma-aminobutyrate hydrolase family protein [Cyclobacterium sp.]